MTLKPLLILGALFATFASPDPAVAQKSKDTLRAPMIQVESALDRYVAPGQFSNIWEPPIFDNLLGFDAKKGVFVPLLVKSWTRPDTLTFEFELRDDVTFHDGQKFTADDVVYTLSYLIDPKVKLRYKRSWEWIKSVEKLSPTKFRVIASAADPDGMMSLAAGTPIYPRHLHEPLADKFEFGTRPVGTGPYRMVQLDKNSGIIAEKNKAFVPGPTKPAAAIGRVVAEPIPDPGTMMAALMTDRVDIISELPIDQALELSKTGRFQVMLHPPTLGYIYLQFPNAAWPRVKALDDARVRLAIAKAIDRKALLRIVYGPLTDQVTLPEALCSKEQLGCGFTKAPPEFDPAGAKRLLAEAGYANGLNLTISAYRENGPHATAISGMLRDVGIRLEVRAVHNSQRLKLLRDGTVEVGYWSWSGGNMFTVSPQIVRHLQSGESEDPEFAKLVEAPFHIMDDAERRKASARAFDYLNERAYSFPMIPSRDILTATKEVGVRNPTELRPQLIGPHEFVWK